MNEKDIENNNRFRKFQPVAEPRGFKIGGLTRTYLEYDESGWFEEWNPTTGELEACGRLNDDTVPDEEAA